MTESFWTGAKKDFISIMLPYFSFALLIYSLWVFVFRYYGHDVPWANEPHIPLRNIFFGDRDKMLVLCIPLWFLPCLFLTRRLFWIAGRIPCVQRSLWMRSIFFVSCGIAGWTYASHSSHRLFWSFDVAFVMLVFFSAGFYLKQQSWIKDPWTVKRNLIWIFSFAVLQVIMVICNELYFMSKNNTLLHIDIGYGKYGHPIFFALAAFFGIIIALRLSHLIASSGKWPQMGAAIMVIFMLHMTGFEIFKMGLTLSFHIPPEQVHRFMEQSLWLNLLCAAFSIGVLAMVTPWFRRHLAWMIGHR